MQNIFWCLRHIEPEMTLAECNLVASFCRANFQSRNSNRYFIFFSCLGFDPRAQAFRRMTRPTSEANTLPTRYYTRVGDGAALE